MEHRPLPLEPVSPESFAAFGQLPVVDGDPDDPVRLSFARRDPHFNFIVHRADEIDHTPDGAAICDLLNRHDTATQTLCPLTAAAMLVVAPASVDFSDVTHLDEVRGFVLRPHEAVNLAVGTWHWGPFPFDADEVRIANVQGRTYATDNAVADLAGAFATVFAVARA